jgi:hypothetical protein
MSITGHQPPEPRRYRALAGLSETEVLDALLAAVRAIAIEDGVPGRLSRRGYGSFSVEVLVQDYEVVKVDVGSKASLKT